MGETACFMQPFSYASGIDLPCDHHNHLEGDPMNALTQSISFGRFVSESASWDRWSVFPSNRYVEEAEKFSRPGSVAQKKAFFEAHYKEMAARKAATVAALLEQANGPVQLDCEIGAKDESSSKNGIPVNSLNNDHQDGTVVEPQDYDCGEPLNITSEVEVSKSYAENEKREREKPWESETSHMNREDGAADLVVEEKIFAENKINDEVEKQFAASNNCEEVGDAESSGSSEVDVSKSYAENEKREREKPWESETSHMDREDGAADLVVEEKIFAENKVNNEVANQFTASNNCEEVGDAESSGSPEMEKPLLQDFVREEVSEDTDQKKPSVVCSKILRRQKASSGVAAAPAIAMSTPLPYWKVKNITPISRNSKVDHSDIKRPTPRRLPLGNLTPVREISKATVSRRFGNQKTFGSLAKDCPTPSKTPTEAPANKSLKYGLATPKSESKRTPVGDGRQTGPKRRSLAKEYSKFSSACKNMLQSPSLSTPFRLRTEERAARRKEKLEEKFDANEREKIQLQNLLKEKEEMEVKKFRQTLCFKARPLPKFYRENTVAEKSPVKKVSQKYFQEESNSLESLKHNQKLWSSKAAPRGGALLQFQGKKQPVLDITLRSKPAQENRFPTSTNDGRASTAGFLSLAKTWKGDAYVKSKKPHCNVH